MPPSATTAWDFDARTLAGKPANLSAWRGQVALIVNTASRCGLTPQYRGLQALYDRFKDRGFVVLGFPSNQFGQQEPGSSDEIAEFCEMNFGVSFPMFEKIDVNGPNAHPLFDWLKSEKPGALGIEAIKWNFSKFLVDREGRVVERYAPTTEPDAIAADVEKLLASGSASDGRDGTSTKVGPAARGPLRSLAAAAVLLAACLALPPATALADASPGQPAPAFTLRDTAGRTVSLADFRGRTVVLEWTNPNCPFVRKHYVSGNLPALQSKHAAGGVVWLAVNSTNPDHVDYLAPPALAKAMKDWGAAPSAVLMDPDGTAGRAYGARTTPQMWVIDPQGTIRFAGGIDDRRSANPDDVKGARNHVAAALEDLAAGRPVAIASAPPYGCGVKYR